MTIFDIITSSEIVAYWELKLQDREPFIGEELFPDDKKLGLDLSWIKGASGLPVMLKPSAFDVQAIPRPRIGFEALKTQMPFFKESYYVDEELRQQLNQVIATGNQAIIDTILNRIFDDDAKLIESASVTREVMRMMVLTTGSIVVEGNGQVYEYDYNMPNNHKTTVKKSWSDPTADIMGDIRDAKQVILDDTGVTVSRAITTSKVVSYFRQNNMIRTSLAPIQNGGAWISDKRILAFLEEELDIQIVVNDKKYIDTAGEKQNYVPDDVFVMFPSGNLGNTWFGTTPEESDLLASSVANVSITDTGVAVTTITHVDPVNVETKVTQIVLPSLPMADSIYILDVIAE